ncbi:hypothetical protein RI129_010468 [Pyrocoelia pectoralis]|uniref:Metalloendopeptidase n=1 Tax=Pyrocoelia pectoralis TaxID=417401 RepID=A0AAN7VAH9_9COLE
MITTAILCLQPLTPTTGMKRNPWQYSGKFEGDMIFSNKRNALTNLNFRWPNGKVCYYIPSNFPDWQKNMIKRAFANGLSGTCVQAVECRNCCGGDYVSITNDKKGCYATVGRTGGAQELNLATNCWYEYVILHEFLHTLGLWHQQNVPNRDNYVQVFLENVIDVEQYNFKKFTSRYVTSFGQRYDYCSLMHYDEFAFSKNGLATIRATRVSMNIIKIVNTFTFDFQSWNCPQGIGRATGLSPIDRNKINTMYCNSG